MSLWRGSYFLILKKAPYNAGIGPDYVQGPIYLSQKLLGCTGKQGLLLTLFSHFSVKVPPNDLLMHPFFSLFWLVLPFYFLHSHHSHPITSFQYRRQAEFKVLVPSYFSGLVSSLVFPFLTVFRHSATSCSPTPAFLSLSQRRKWPCPWELSGVTGLVGPHRPCILKGPFSPLLMPDW